MRKVFVERSAEGIHVQLSDGRMMPLEDLVRDYERLLKEESLKKDITSEPNEDKPITSELKVGEWFRIDREVINKNKEEICRKCDEAGEKGKELWERFEESNKIADENTNRYPRLIETYIFEHSWMNGKTEKKMRDMCKDVGAGMCCEVICDLELQMRICNGESVDDLVKKADKLPYVRVIKLRDGGTGYFGGGVAINVNRPPANLERYDFDSFYYHNQSLNYTPYAFRFVHS